MSKKVCFTIVLGILISYPLAAATPFDGVDLAKPSKLATLRIAVDQETGVTYTELLGPEAGMDKLVGPGSYVKDPPIQLHGQTTCPTCNNCPAPEQADRGEILFLCLCFDPSHHGTMVLPTAGQKYGFELVPYTGPGGHLHGSAVSATHEIVCAQKPPAMGYEFEYYQHCGMAVSVEVNSCAGFEVWYSAMATVYP